MQRGNYRKKVALPLSMDRELGYPTVSVVILLVALILLAVAAILWKPFRNFPAFAGVTLLAAVMSFVLVWQWRVSHGAAMGTSNVFILLFFDPENPTGMLDRIPSGTVNMFGETLAVVIWLSLLMWLVRPIARFKRKAGEVAHYRRTAVRSIVPILAAAVIVVGLICGMALQRSEASAVGWAGGQVAGVEFDREVERSSFIKLRDHFRQEQAEMKAKQK
jgi:uncharacterized membrane protein YidH (DUF202 family)